VEGESICDPGVSLNPTNILDCCGRGRRQFRRNAVGGGSATKVDDVVIPLADIDYKKRLNNR